MEEEQPRRQGVVQLDLTSAAAPLARPHSIGAGSSDRWLGARRAFIDRWNFIRPGLAQVEIV